MFMDDLTDYFTKWMASYRNIMICGDFNMHIAGLTEAQMFNDNMEALGLQQHINFETHHAGNILDLLSEGKKHRFMLIQFTGPHPNELKHQQK